MRIRLLFVLLGMAPFTLLADDQDELLKRLEKGEIVTSKVEVGGEQRAQAEAVIDAKVDEVWKVISDYEHYPEFMPRIRKTKVLERKGNIALVKTELSFVIKTIRYTLRMVHHKDKGLITWTMAEGDLKKINGSWTLLAHAGGKKTRARYNVATVMGFKIPRSIELFLTERNLPGILKAVRKRAANKRDH